MSKVRAQPARMRAEPWPLHAGELRRPGEPRPQPPMGRHHSLFPGRDLVTRAPEGRERAREEEEGAAPLTLALASSTEPPGGNRKRFCQEPSSKRDRARPAPRAPCPAPRNSFSACGAVSC